MKFDLRINPGWTVIDVKSGLRLTRIRWVDDATHLVAWCECARQMDKKAGSDIVRMLGDFGITPDSATARCSDDEFVKGMPKVKIDTARKTVLVNVDDAIQPEEPVDERQPVPQRAAEKRVLVILAGIGTPHY